MAASPARVVAARTLQRLATDDNAFTAEALDQEIVRSGAGEDDSRLAAGIVYLTLRNAYLLDYQYRLLLRQSPSRLSVETRLLFRMAACQKLLLSRIPAHAIVNDTVELARRIFRLHPREIGFINAIARKIVLLKSLGTPEPEADNYLQVRYSVPDWLITLFLRKFGSPSVEPLLASLNEEPLTSVRHNALAGTMQELRGEIHQMGGKAQDGELSPAALVIQDMPWRRLLSSPAFREGKFYLQDEGSQFVSYLAEPSPGQEILDLCAAPGGKTTHMAELAQGKARVTATDISERRLQLVRENVERLATPGVVLRPYGDVTGATEAVYDCVLVDAPCSGLGTLRRNPEIRYRCSSADLPRISSQQLDILSSAADHVRPGGRLVYSTCTVSNEENEGVIKKFLEMRPDFHVYCPTKVPCAIGALRQEDGFYRTWPDHHAIDGFEAIVLQRRQF